MRRVLYNYVIFQYANCETGTNYLKSLVLSCVPSCALLYFLLDFAVRNDQNAGCYLLHFRWFISSSCKGWSLASTCENSKYLAHLLLRLENVLCSYPHRLYQWRCKPELVFHSFPQFWPLGISLQPRTRPTASSQQRQECGLRSTWQRLLMLGMINELMQYCTVGLILYWVIVYTLLLFSQN